MFIICSHTLCANIKQDSVSMDTSCGNTSRSLTVTVDAMLCGHKSYCGVESGIMVRMCSDVPGQTVLGCFVLVVV